MYSMIHIVINTVLNIWKLFKRVDLKSSHYKKKIVTMYDVDINWTFIVIILQYIPIRSLCCTLETNPICRLYLNLKRLQKAKTNGKILMNVATSVIEKIRKWNKNPIIFSFFLSFLSTYLFTYLLKRTLQIKKERHTSQWAKDMNRYFRETKNS